MPRTADQIFKELGTYFNPSAQVLKQRRRLIQPQTNAILKGLEQTKVNEFENIGTRAARKGLSFSGLSSAEEAKYLGESYLPAIAQTKIAAQEQRLSLGEALAGLRREQGLLAQQIRQQEIDRAEARRAASAAAASQTSAIDSMLAQLFGGGEGGGAPGQSKVTAKQLSAEAKKSAEEYASRMWNRNQSNPEVINNVITGLRERAVRNKDLLAREQVIQLSKLAGYPNPFGAQGTRNALGNLPVPSGVDRQFIQTSPNNLTILDTGRF